MWFNEYILASHRLAKKPRYKKVLVTWNLVTNNKIWIINWIMIDNLNSSKLCSYSNLARFPPDFEFY